MSDDRIYRPLPSGRVEALRHWSPKGAGCDPDCPACAAEHDLTERRTEAELAVPADEKDDHRWT